MKLIQHICMYRTTNSKAQVSKSFTLWITYASPFPLPSLHFCDYYTQINEKCVCVIKMMISTRMYYLIPCRFISLFCEYGTFPLYMLLPCNAFIAFVWQTNKKKMKTFAGCIFLSSLTLYIFLFSQTISFLKWGFRHYIKILPFTTIRG